MTDTQQKTAPEEIAILLKRTGLRLNPQQFAALCDSYDEFEAAAQRLRKGLARNDEPAFALRIPKDRAPD
jgi:hypothetical protein